MFEIVKDFFAVIGLLGVLFLAGCFAFAFFGGAWIVSHPDGNGD